MRVTRLAYPILVSILSLGILSCGSSRVSTPPSSGTPTTPSPDFSLTLSGSSLSVAAGAAAGTLSVTATATNGFTGNVAVSLSGLPDGVTITPTTLTLTPGEAQSISFTAASNAAAAQATVTLTAVSGSLTHTATFALAVAAASSTAGPDFSLVISPASLALTAGATGQAFSVNAAALNGFTGPVNVALSGLPAGVTASPSTLTLVPGTAQKITLTAAGSAAAANATVTVTGTAASLTHTVSLALTVAAAAAVAGVDVTTYHYNNGRTGTNSSETTLTPANVNTTGFGKLALYATDGKVDAAPLYVSGLSVGGQTHNVLYVVSEHDSVYAFDADTGTQLWTVSVLASGETTSDDHGCGQISPEIGITSTPVIDRSHGTNGAIFVVGMTKDSSGGYHQRLHALDLVTGAELSGSPSEITATYPGSGAFSINGLQVFAPGQYAERAALLLMNGEIFMGWTSHCDDHPYTGWLMAYSESTLKQSSVLNLTPNSGGTGFGEGEGSIWMAGAGIAGDDNGNVYFLDANGGFDATLDANGFPIHQDYGNAFMKVNYANNKLTVADYFNTSNTVTQSNDDVDLGSGGAILLPAMTDASGKSYNLAVGAGKDSNIYVVDSSNMGKFDASANHNYQQLTGALPGGVFANPVYFNGTIYYGSVGNVMQAFELASAKVQVAASSQTADSFPYPGTAPSVSANGTQNGIVWAVQNAASGGALHAYDATDLSKELYDSSQTNGRDSFVDNKFITPVVANGKVFVGTTTGVVVFGLK